MAWICHVGWAPSFFAINKRKKDNGMEQQPKDDLLQRIPRNQCWHQQQQVHGQHSLLERTWSFADAFLCEKPYSSVRVMVLSNSIDRMKRQTYETTIAFLCRQKYTSPYASLMVRRTNAAVAETTEWLAVPICLHPDVSHQVWFCRTREHLAGIFESNQTRQVTLEVGVWTL